MSFSAAALRAALDAHAPAGTTGWVVAVSGGLDSTCLVTAMAELRSGSPRDPSVRAVHVDHGLQPAALDFRHGCETLCGRLDVPLRILEVAVASTRGVSIEAAARDARYAALAEDLASGECLLTAHHASDQAETVLLQLLRGAGLKGMSAMPLCRVFGPGWHLRPMLQTPKEHVLRFAAQHDIGAVSDPMNEDRRFDRAYLRADVWPSIERRWPGAAVALSRAARHLAEAQVLVEESAALAVQRLSDGDALSVTGLRTLNAPQQVSAVRHWIVSRAAVPPPASRLAEALRQVLNADDDHLPTVIWGDHALRRYRDRLFLTAAIPPSILKPLEWRVGLDSTLELGSAMGMLRWGPQAAGLDPARLPPAVIVRCRDGGESLKPHRRARSQSVQHLCQSLGVLPWMRGALPMVYADGTLIAIGNLWQDARWCVRDGATGLGCFWDAAPMLV